ncbi:methyl-accepting chemotaxis protein [Undibacterium griseum]|uniref:Methyl-accepting chemotaxis protein n=1 Tax=Undibacterium griseum TaxID=2762295 RepID=A0ABR6YLB5_9BURK|nr:methyl-accepting chemotaxis protein [Undibacterium griseum]MBC3884687.1 hypothetical protein [Undibacterium griseum]
MRSLFSPAIRLMQNLRISQKIAFISAGFAIPLFIVLALLFSELRIEVASAKNKQHSLQLIQQHQALATLIRQHRTLLHLQLTGNKQVADRIKPLETTITQAMDTAAPNSDLKKQWSNLSSAVMTMKAPDSFKAHTQLLELINQKTTQLANSSKLSLDSDFTTNELSSLYLKSLPALEEKISVMASRGAAYIDTGLFEAGEDVMLNSLQMSVKVELGQLSNLINQYQKENTEYKTPLENLQTALTNVQKYFDRAQDEVLASVNQSSGKAFSEGGDATIQQLNAAGTNVAHLVDQRLGESITRLNLKIIKMFSAIIVLILIASYFLMAIYLTLSKEIQVLTEAIEKTASGDFSNIHQHAGKDEFAQLTNAVSTMNQSLSQLIAGIRSDAVTVNDIAHEIHEETVDLASRTDHQAGALQQTASSVEQLTGTIQENAANLAQASSLIHSSATHVNQGLEVMEKAIDSMQSVTHNSKKISEIIGVMDSISFQTNILALNAAVEAARAGQEGRGFAVVASEVRNLAQRSASAAKEIKALITTSGTAIEQGSNMINSAGKTMQEIATNVKQVTHLIKHVSDASQEQSKGISSVNQAITRIDEITQHNASLVEQATASTNKLEQQAMSLSTAVSVFRISAVSEKNTPVISIQAIQKKKAATHQVAAFKQPQKKILRG